MTELARIDRRARVDRRAKELAEQYAGFTDAASLTDGEKIVALVGLVPMALTVVEEARDTIERLNNEIERLTAERDERIDMPGDAFPDKDDAERMAALLDGLELKDRAPAPEGLPSLPDLGRVTPPGAIGYGLGQVKPERALELDRQILAFRKVVRLHTPVTLWLPHPDADYSFESYEDAVEYVTDDLDDSRENDEEARAAAIAGITSFEVCAHCRNIESGQAEDRGYEYAVWPCRTAQCWVVT